MHRWRTLVPFVAVVGFNLFAACGDNDRVRWQQLVRGCGAWATVLFLAGGLGAALLAYASHRRRAWAVVVPALPPLVAVLASARDIADELTCDTFPTTVGFFSRSLSGEAGLLRVLAAQQGLALALALVITHAAKPDLRTVTRPRRAVVAIAFGVTVAALLGPWRALDALDLGISQMALTLLAFALALPPLLVAFFESPRADGVARDVTPYRASASTNAHPPPEGASLAVMGALLTPWLARGYTRGAVWIEGAWSSITGHFFDYPTLAHRNALLAFASRWDRCILPMGAALVVVALARGIDRRVARAWAVALALLAGGDMLRVGLLQRLRAKTAPTSVEARFWMPGSAWLARATPPQPSREVLVWRRDGTATSHTQRDEDWHLGPRVHVDSDMRGDVWRAHLRRWRAASPEGLLTIAGVHTSTLQRWYFDPRQELPLADEPYIQEAHAVFEVADAVSTARMLVVRVVDAATVEVADPLAGTTSRIRLDAWRPGLLTRDAVVIPASDAVTASAVVGAAIRVSDGRVRVALGW